MGDLVLDSSSDPCSALETVRQHVKWDAAIVVEHAYGKLHPSEQGEIIEFPAVHGLHHYYLRGAA